MTILIKKIVLLFFFLTLTACSYSPNMLKDVYNELDTEIADDLKKNIDLSANQEAKIDRYASELMKWHRRNKLPKYAHTIAQLSSSIQQDNLLLPALQVTLRQLDDLPHFEEAHHLTPLLQEVAGSLNKSQISQIEEMLNDEYQKERLEIKTEKITDDINKNINQMFNLLEVSLNAKQRKILMIESKNFHDLRWVELEYGRKWNTQFIALLKKSNSLQPQRFSHQFTQLWRSQSVKFQGKALRQDQQNAQRLAKLVKTLVTTLSTDKKNKLVSQLTSIGHTFSEMANE